VLALNPLGAKEQIDCQMFQLLIYTYLLIQKLTYAECDILFLVVDLLNIRVMRKAMSNRNEKTKIVLIVLAQE
jgi:hypothetical protein